MSDGVIGVLGASGAVGRATVAELVGWGSRALRLGVRRPVTEAVPPDADVRMVSVDQSESLARFCSGCAVVVNCAGPADDIGDLVASAALAAGAHYVDPAGEALHQSLLDAGTGDRRVLLSAGMLPGLSALLPRMLARDFDRVTSLVAHVGGMDRFTRAAAADYLASLRNGFGRSMAELRDGRVVASPPTRPVAETLPYFPGPVTAYPYLSTETERVAERLGLAAVRWHNVFGGEQVPAVLASAVGGPPAAVADLVAAADRDLVGRDPYQLFVMTLDGLVEGGVRCRTLVLRAPDSYRLTAFVTALATEAALHGTVPAGVHLAGEALDLDHAERRIADTASIGYLRIQPGPAQVDGSIEEGVL